LAEAPRLVDVGVRWKRGGDVISSIPVACETGLVKRER